MVNRLNVKRLDGSRTTVRFPPELFRLYAFAVGSESLAKENILDAVYRLPLSSDLVLSDFVRGFMTEGVHQALPPSRSKASKASQTIL